MVFAGAALVVVAVGAGVVAVSALIITYCDLRKIYLPIIVVLIVLTILLLTKR